MMRKTIYIVAAAFMAVNAAYWLLVVSLFFRDGDTSAAMSAFNVGLIPIMGAVAFVYIAQRTP